MTYTELNILAAIEKIRTPFLNGLFEAVTALGEHTVMVVIIAAIYFAVSKESAKRLLFITMVSLSVNGIIKNFVKRPRPFSTGKVSCVRPETATGYSFPSGHTQSFATWSTAVAGIIKKKAFWIFAIVGTVLVALSRVYLGAHYPSDVIVGAIIGVSISLGLNALWEKVRDKYLLYKLSILAIAPFAIIFIIQGDKHFADLFKIYGMLCGLYCASLFEEKYVSLDINASIAKKLLRIIIGIVLALVIKELASFVLDFESVYLWLISQWIRYFILVFTVMGLYPWVIKKTHL